MPKPNHQQIRDAIDEAMDTNGHLGREFAIQSVMKQYDISGVDVALAFMGDEEEPAAEVRTGDDASATAAVSELGYAGDKDDHTFPQSDEDQLGHRSPDNIGLAVDENIEEKKKAADEEAAAKKAAMDAERQALSNRSDAGTDIKMTHTGITTGPVADVHQSETNVNVDKKAVPGEAVNQPNQGFAKNNPNRDLDWVDPNVSSAPAEAEVAQKNVNVNVDKKPVPAETKNKANQGFAKNNPNRKK